MIQVQLEICLSKIFVAKCSEPQVITIKETGLVNCSGSLTGKRSSTFFESVMVSYTKKYLL